MKNRRSQLAPHTGGLPRRTVLTVAGAGALAFALAACTPEKKALPAAARDDSAKDQQLTWANWPAYLDTGSDGGHPTLKSFEKKTGIAVHYDETVSDNARYNSAVSERLARGHSIGADTVCLADWVVAQWVAHGYAQKLSGTAMPNTENLLPSLRTVEYDPGRKKTMPWVSGYAGICWNKDRLPKGLTSVSELWNASLKGAVGVVSDMRDAVGLIMLENGVDISSSIGKDNFSDAVDILARQVRDGQVRYSTSTSYLDDLKSGKTVAALAWSNDINQLNAKEGDRWGFALPDAGGTLKSDNFVVPLGATHRANVEKLINYYYQPEVAAEVAAWTRCLTPVAGAKEAAHAVDPQLAKNTLIFPDDEMLARAHSFATITARKQNRFQLQFEQALTGALVS